MKQLAYIFGYFIECLLSAAVLNWYDHIWFASNTSYWLYYAISVVVVWLIIGMAEADQTFKKVWSTICSLILVAALIAQCFIWFGATNPGILSK